MAWFKLSTILILVGTLAVATQNIQAASTTNGKLLKFFPITTEQYKSIMKLATQQAAISEDRVMESHRSLADWSNTLHTSWTNLFNYSRPDNEVLRGYPICVINGDDPRVRRKRSTRQYGRDYKYAGLAPTVVYTGSPDYPHYERPEYSRPPYGGRPPHYRPPHGRPPYDEEEEDQEADEEEDEEDEPNTTEPEESVTDGNGPIVNCVVVIKRKNKTPSRVPPTVPDPEGEFPRPHLYPHYPYPPHGYPHYDPSKPMRPPVVHYPYPSHGYPHYDPSKPMSPPVVHYPYPPVPPYYGYPPLHEHESRSNGIQTENSIIGPAAEAHYQQMLNEYYNHLYRLYWADASNHADRQEEIDSAEVNK